MKNSFFSALGAVLLALAPAISSADTSPAQAATPTTTRIVVKYKDGVVKPQSATAHEARAKALSATARVQLSAVKEASSGAVIYQLPQEVSVADARVVALRLANDPDVAYAAPDVRVRITGNVPNDPYANMQWPALPQSQSYGSANFFAIPMGSGANRIVVAVIDTGSVPHSDMTANELQGYDFVSDTRYSGDGDGRDNDPSDVGDYCESEGTNSSWHGLKTSSLIAAIANNGNAITGAAGRSAQVLHVRALGRCGGWLTDIADAVMWSAGGAVSGVPTNGTPARVINLSLGAPSGTACFPYMQDAVDYATTHRVVVVTAAGNEGTEGVGAPANCSGVITVGAHTRSGDLANYSNRGAGVTLTAPGGGNCQVQTATCLGEPPVSLSNAGTRSPAGEMAMTYFSGTSAAVPHVSAAAALLLAANGELTSSQVRSVLVSTARVHAADSYCAANATKCGAGMLDAQAAISSVSAPVLTLTYPTKQILGSTKVTLSVSAQGGTAPYTYQWTQLSGPLVALTNADTANAQFTAPATRGPAMVFQVKVTSNNGLSTTDMATVGVNNPAKLTIPSNVNVTAGSNLAQTLAASDVDGDAVRVVIVQGPTGAAITAGNILTWNAPPEGTHAFVLMATDDASDGTGDSAQFTMTVTVAKATSGGGGSSSGGSSSDGGGGGGAFGLLALAVLAAFTGLFYAKRRKRESSEPFQL